MLINVIIGVIFIIFFLMAIVGLIRDEARRKRSERAENWEHPGVLVGKHLAGMK